MGNREMVSKFKTEFENQVEKHTADIGQHTKAIKVCEITVTNLQSGVANDLQDMRTEMNADRSKLQVEVADARAAGVRAASNNDSRIESLASEIQPLRQFREQILERLDIKKFVNIVQDWQVKVIPQVTAAVQDLEERARKLLMHQVKDHETLCELQKSTAEIRRHFKLFHAIADAFDDKPHPNLPEPMLSTSHADRPPSGAAEDTRLPPIMSARGPPKSQSPIGGQPPSKSPTGGQPASWSTGQDIPAL